MQKYNVGILLFEDVEVLDFAGPFEVFSVTAQLTGYNFIDVFTVSEKGEMITAKNGLKVMSDYSFDYHPEISILILPGGDGVRKLLHKATVKTWLEAVHDGSIITASVCSGALILGKYGYLNGIESTTHHEVIEELRSIAPKTTILEDSRFVDSGSKIMTSGGISAGIDLSLYIVSKLLGETLSKNTMKYMEYGDWKKS